MKEAVLIRNGDILSSQSDDTLTLEPIQHLRNRFLIDADLSGEKGCCEGKGFKSRAVPMRFEPTRHALRRRMELTAAHRNDRMAIKKQTVPGQGFGKIG